MTAIKNNNVNVSNETKKVLNLNTKENKETLLNAKKQAIKEGTKLDLKSIDFLNLKKTIKTKEIDTIKKVNEKHFIYKFQREGLSADKQKALRQKIRKQIEVKINNIIYYFNNEKVEDLLNSIEIFKAFYLETYILNDYSFNSIYANHIEEQKGKDLKNVLNIIKSIS